MKINPSAIKELRERTGAGMLDCKKALEEKEGNIEAAIDLLREKGIAKAAKKSSRVAAEGLVFGGVNDKVAVVLEFNSETDFVAKNDGFKDFGSMLVNLALDKKINNVESLLELEVEGKTVSTLLTELIARIGENLKVRRLELIEAKDFVVNYIHLGGKIGVLVEVEGENSETNLENAKGVAMHIAAMDPRYLDKSEVTSAELEKEAEIIKNQLLEEGKPLELVEKITKGKIAKFYEENCLLQQKYVRDDKKTIENFMKPAKIVKFVRFKVGEGIEKAESDFAAEVAAQVAGANK